MAADSRELIARSSRTRQYPQLSRPPRRTDNATRPKVLQNGTLPTLASPTFGGSTSYVRKQTGVSEPFSGGVGGWTGRRHPPLKSP
eukprot:4719413-Prymnesium_polylepis.2